MNLISLFISNIIANNLLLTKYVGLNILIEKRNAIKISVISVFISIISVFTYYFIYNNLIIGTYLLNLFKTLIFILIIVSITKLFEISIKKISNINYQIFNEDKTLIIISLLMMSIIQFNAVLDFKLLDMIVFLITSGLGYIFITYVFLSLVDRFKQCDDIPKSFIGIPLSFITLAIIFLIFSRYI